LRKYPSTGLLYQHNLYFKLKKSFPSGASTVYAYIKLFASGKLFTFHT
jgi:hypothetical protein